MNSRSVLAAALAASVLAACSSEPEIDAEDASVADVQEQLSGVEVRPRPGRWQQEFKIEEMDMPGLPEEAKAAMARGMNMTHSGFTCLTPEQTEKPDASFFQQTGQNCTYDHFKMADGVIDAKLTCMMDGVAQVSTMKGSFGPESYDMTIAMQAQMMGQPMNSRMSLKMTRVGDCTGDEGA